MSNEKIRYKEQHTNKKRERESGGNVLGMGAQKGLELCEWEAPELTAMQYFSLDSSTFSGTP